MQLLLLVAFATLIAGTIGLGALALEATGLERRKARFQSLSAFTGTGFTTSEAEAVVNHAQRRRIISTLIVVGNLGVLGLLGALVVVLVRGAGSQRGLLWAIVLLGAVLLYGLVLGRWLNPAVKRGLARLFRLQPVAVEELAQLPDGRTVFAVTVADDSGLAGRSVQEFEAAGIDVLAGGGAEALQPGDLLICAGDVAAVKALLE